MTELKPLICVPCQPQDVATRLVDAFKKRDVSEFHAAASQLSDVATSSPQLVTCLGDACKDAATVGYVRALLEACVDPSTPDKSKSKAPTPLQVAAENNNITTIKVLLAHPKVDLSAKDKFGNNVFHWIVKNNGKADIQAKCIDELLKHKQANVVINAENRKYETAMLLAARQCDLEVIQSLLAHHGLDLDSATTVDTKQSARSLIVQRFQDMGDKLPPPLPVTFTDSDLMRLLDDKRDGDKVKTFCDKVLLGGHDVNYHDDRHTLLQRACKEGLTDVVQTLLEHGADPVATCLKNKQPPPLIASSQGNAQVLEVFLKQSDVRVTERVESVLREKQDSGDTGLIQLLRAWDDSKSEDYFSCLSLLLSLDVDVNATNRVGNTALHYAALTGERRVILALLQHGAYIGGVNNMGRSPIVNVPYDVLEEHFDSCLQSDQPPYNDNYKIEFDYSCLVPPVTHAQISEPPKTSKPGDCEAGNGKHVSEAREGKSGEEREGKSGEQREGKRENAVMYLETQPLVYMSRSVELRPLLKHPVLTSFLELKWNRVSSIYHFNTIFYFFFVVAISVHILCGNGRIHRADAHNATTEDNSNSLQARESLNPGFVCQLWVPLNTTRADDTNNTSFKSDDEYNTFYNILHGVVIVLWAILVLREAIQFLISPKRYFSPSNKENYVELLLIFSCFLFGLFQFLDVYVYARFFAAVTILLTYGEFILLVGRYPTLSTYIEMLRRVSWNFSKFLLWYSILILAFALSFYTLFRDSDEESNFFKFFGMSVFKTVVMMTGEFDVSDIPFVELPILSHLVFVMFVFLIAIVLFNLLNGLAVSDTQAIKDDAELVGYVSRVHLIAYIEKIILGDTSGSCSWCSGSSFSRVRSLVRRVQLFPSHLPYIGRIVPNDTSYLYLTLPDTSHEKSGSLLAQPCCAWFNLDLCCLPEQASCRLKRDIVKRAEEVIAVMGRPSEMEQIKMAVEENGEKLERMEGRWREMEKMMGEILELLAEKRGK